MADYPNNKYTSTYTGTEIDEAVASAKDTAEKLPTLQSTVTTLQSTVTAHIGNTNNPHGVNKEDVDLGKVENLSPAEMPISTATQTALNNKVGTKGDQVIAGSLTISADASNDYSGDLVVQGNLTVKGTTFTNDTETLTVKDNLIITNSTGKTLVGPSGLAINVGGDTAYAIVYDPSQEAVRLGKGTVTANEDNNNEKEFTFNENEGKPIVVRDDTLDDVNDKYLAQWNNAQKAIVAAKSGALCGDLTVDGTATAFVSGQDQFALKARFRTGESQFGAVYFGKQGDNSGSMIRIDQVEGTPRLYFRASSTEGAMVWSQPEDNSTVYFDVPNVYFRKAKHKLTTSGLVPDVTNASDLGSSTNRFKDLYLAGTINGQLTIPNKSGTLATTADIPEAPVTSVNGQTGPVKLTKADVGLGNVDNIADANQVKHGQQTLDSASLPSNNLNNVTQPGWYVMASSNSVTNKPTGVAGFSLEVMLCADNKIIQKLYDDFTNIYIRIRTASTTWSNWAQLSTSNTNIPYVKEISSSDWTGSTRPYKVTITGSTHGKGKMPSVTVFEQLNGTYVQVGADPTIDMTTGNVTIESNAKLALRVLID